MGYLARIVLPVYLGVLAGGALADTPPAPTDHPFADIRSRTVLHGGPAPGTAKSVPDTCVLIGPASLSPVVIGTFEDASGDPHWNGWTTFDWTVPDTSSARWQVSDYFAVNGAYSAYCGDESLPSCGAGDPPGGYGNSWAAILKWGMVVADPGQPTSLEVNFAFDIDSEATYDYAVLARELANFTRDDIWQLDGDTTGVVTVPVSYAAGEYCGEALNEVGIWFLGTSDGGWSDEDCDYPSTGLWRVDDVTITSDNPATVVVHDFEDGTLGPFAPAWAGPVGDFAHLATNLDDPDFCIDNHTPQVVFIDDGVVQPATGGSYATADNRRYANNFVVNYTGGLTFNEQHHLRNMVVSPVIPWQEPVHDLARFGFGYMLDSFFLSGEAGVWMEWWVRSTTGDAASIEDAAWRHSPYVYPGGPHYDRRFWDVSDDLQQGRTYVQVALGAVEIGYVWGLDGHNGSPSPWFDNVRLETMPAGGPALSARSYWLAQSAFPEIGELDTADLGRNHVRFDRAQNISPVTDEHVHYGDSLTVDAVPLRTGAVLTGRPRMHYKLWRNPVFDAHRSAGLPDSGVIVMDTTFTPAGTFVADRYCVDLPDTGFLFPGDVFHYYFSAEDAIGWASPMTSTLPADLTGWGDFGDEFAWNHEFTMRCLPSVREGYPAGTYVVPPTLYWDDSESEGAGTRAIWANNFWYLGHQSGDEFDYFYAKAPGTAAGAGLAGRATVNLLGNYENVVYFSGDVSMATLSNGDWSYGGGNDISLLVNWLALGERDLFLSGNKLAYDLNSSGAEAYDFLRYRMGVAFDSDDHVDLLGGQLAPRVLEVPDNPVLWLISSWHMNGNCPDLRKFDLVTPLASTRVALFANHAGVDGGYPYSAMTLRELANASRIVFMSMDLSQVEPDPYENGYPGTEPSARSRILRSVITYFDQWTPGPPRPGTPAAGVFGTANYPNPFNPVTEIEYSIERPGRLTVKIYNLRGQVVRTLLDRRVEQGGKVAWDGTDAQGGQVASGVYFYEARMGGEVEIGKMALIK